MGAAAENRLQGITVSAANGAVQITGTGATDAVYRLERTTDLAAWRDWLQLIPSHGSFRVQDSSVSGTSARFYRFSTRRRTAADDWKNQVTAPTDPFLAAEDGDQVRWIKFLILTEDPTRVYFQDSTKYVLHYEFAKARLPQFAGLSRAAFDAVTLHRTNQQAILGSLLLPPRTNVLELGLQFAGQDAYGPDWIARYFPLVLEAVEAPSGTKVFYFPAFEQQQAAQMSEAALQAQGIPLGSVYRWLSGDQVYAPGWATGPLRYIVATDIARAYAEGRLRPTDILLTDGVPAEIPFVAGILSLAPATPNSHVAVFAGANDIPFAYLADEARQRQVRQLDGREVILRAGIRYGYNQVTIADVAGQLDDAARAELLALKVPVPANIAPRRLYGQFSADTIGLKPEDRQYFGGKAANYGILRRLIPDHSEPAIAFSFDLWEAFMDQTIPPGNTTLRDLIHTRLASFTNYPPEITAVQTNLAAIRELITDHAEFTLAQQQAILSALAPFDPARKIRFRSSSNAEDSKSFVGAGLYDSFSGCLLDDLDSDKKGPCQCDPTEPKERGVFRAIQKAYASFYNDNAFLERLRHGIDESQVAMGLLVHHSAPDETEMANGVAKVHYEAPTSWVRTPQLVSDLVTQAGAESVTNPDTSALPEVVRVTEVEAEQPSQTSSLVPLGSTVLTYPADYEALFGLMKRVYTNYSALAGYQFPEGPLLDFEYKKIRPGWLQLKQVRELPQQHRTLVDPFLVNEPTTYEVFNCEQTSAMADHRLKCRLTLETRNVRLTDTNLARSFYTDGRFELRLGTEVQALTGAPSTWPGASHAVTQTASGRAVQDRWEVGSGAERRTYVLTTIVPTVNPDDGLVLTARDLAKRLDVTYASPQPEPDGPATTTDFVRLIMAPDPATLSPGPTETYQAGRLSVSITFLASSDVTHGLPPTADPLADGEFPAYYPSWAQATLTGLLAEPVVLSGYYATTGALGHKAAFQWHLFEPAADPSLPAAQRQAFESANIKLIYVYREVRSGTTTVRVLGTDDVFRNL